MCRTRHVGHALSAAEFDSASCPDAHALIRASFHVKHGASTVQPAIRRSYAAARMIGTTCRTEAGGSAMVESMTVSAFRVGS